MDRLVYLFHGFFWSAFLVRALRSRGSEDRGAASGRATPARAARHRGLVLLVHALGFGALYAGISQEPAPATKLFHMPWVIGAAVILLGAALFAWSLLVFDSWRVLAKLDSGHRLCTRGPYRLVRHPIYLACDLLALGTFLWIPTWTTLAGVLLMFLGGDLRARVEEKLMLEVFGEEYRHYRERSGRFLPRIG